MKRRRDIDSARIAKLVGVSRSTVSKVINNYPNVAARTRAKVLDAVRHHQYYPHVSAQILAGKRTRTLGLFLANPQHWSEDLHASLMLSSMIEHASELGYHVLSYITGDHASAGTRDTIQRVFYQRRVDAGLFVGFKNHESVVEELIADGLVVGVFDQFLPGREEPNRVVVNFDDHNCAAATIDYLAQLGHEKIGLLNGDRTRNAGQARYEGFLSGLQRNDLRVVEDWMLFADFSEHGAERAVEQFLKRRRPLPTAIAAVNDHSAFGAIHTLDRCGVSVPGDISVIGMDGHPLSAYVRPALTTFEFDFDAMLKSLVTSVIAAAEGPPRAKADTKVFAGTLVARESCRRLT